MGKVPKMITVTQLKHDYKSVLPTLADQPVLLTQNSEPVAVMVSPDDWNAACR